ncbi:MAG TPA: rod shape-determining protein MreC, partial [Parachlamydiaceae bacterium]|nr:rod shape-determining protein MreC [Parachlamydiaceae bacterium]
MRKTKTKSYFLLLILLFLVLSLPAFISEGLQKTAIETLSPLFEKFSYFNQSSKAQEKIERLELENKLLYANFIQLLDLVENKDNLMLLEEATPAKVIFRSAGSWFSSLWINVGHNSKGLIGKNSPVLAGNAVIGIIDYCGKKQSRVRLITDSALSPSVRVLRHEGGEIHYLAKGELKGAAKPLFRSGGNQLFGIGFNYDFADDKGFARDLRTGEPQNEGAKQKVLPLLKVNDLLVTTGMDG